MGASGAASATPLHFSSLLSFSLLPHEEHELEREVESSSTLSWPQLCATTPPHTCVLNPTSARRPSCVHRRLTQSIQSQLYLSGRTPRQGWQCSFEMTRQIPSASRVAPCGIQPWRSAGSKGTAETRSRRHRRCGEGNLNRGSEHAGKSALRSTQQ